MRNAVFFALYGPLCVVVLLSCVAKALGAAAKRMEAEFDQWRDALRASQNRGDFDEGDRLCRIGPKGYAIEVANGGAAAIAVEKNACSIAKLDSEINDPLVEVIATKYGRAAA